MGCWNPGTFSNHGCLDKTKFQGLFGMDQMSPWTLWRGPHVYSLKMFHGIKQGREVEMEGSLGN